MKPTDEQIKEFWERFGVKAYTHTGHEDDYQYPNKHWGKQPKIDLNNLFKYAVPKLMEGHSNHLDLTVRRFIAPNEGDLVNLIACEIWSDNGNGCVLRSDKDPALALFWAIREAIHERSK